MDQGQSKMCCKGQGYRVSIHMQEEKTVMTSGLTILCTHELVSIK